MKVAVIITQSNPEQVFTALRFANFALNEGDAVSIFLAAEGVELEKIDDPRFDVRGQAETFIRGGGGIQACGSCLRLRDSAGSDICPLSTMKDMYTLIKESERVVTF